MKTLTFTVEDALLSPIGFSVLSGAGLVKKKDAEGQQVNAHMTTVALIDSSGVIDLSDALNNRETLNAAAPLFIIETESDGSITGEVIKAEKVTQDNSTITVDTKHAGKTVFVDYYVFRNSSTISEIQIDAENFAGYYYVEADTLFRREDTGVDMPAVLTIPNVKIQSNFTFTMAATGDPSTFTFTMDAFPGYTYFDHTKKVLCVLQVIEDNESAIVDWDTVMPANVVEG